MKSLFFIFIVILTIPLLAQTTQCVSYNYDEAGNRIKRRIINMTNLAVTTNNYVNETINESENLESLDYLPPLIEKIINHEIKIFPNPTTGKLQLTISNLNENENALISLFDVSGKFFYKKEIFADNVLIDLSEKLAGTYFMSIRIQEKETIWTIIKQ